MDPSSAPELRQMPLGSDDARRGAEAAHTQLAVDAGAAAAAAPSFSTASTAAFGFGDDADDSFGFDACDPAAAKRDSGNDGGGVSCGAFDFGDLDAALDLAAVAAAAAASMALRPTAPPGHSEGQPPGQIPGTAKPLVGSGAPGESPPTASVAALPPPLPQTCVVVGEPLPPILPEFYLYADEEPAGVVH